MALFKLLHSHSHSHHQISIKIKYFSPSLSLFSRTLCSSQESQNPENAQQIIQPVSYAVKPKNPSMDSQEFKNPSRDFQESKNPSRDFQESKNPSRDFQESKNPSRDFQESKNPSRDFQESQNNGGNAAREGPVSNEARGWTREDIRYVKDMPGITPVAYPSRVAPLPDDRPRGGVGEGGELGEGMRVGNESRVQQQMRRILRGGREEEETVKVPFPTLIKVDKGKKKVVYDIKDAIQLVKANAKRNFDETLEAHVKLTPDLRRTDLKLSGSVMLPHGTTKNVRVAVFAEGAAADDAREAGADIVGGKELIDGIKNETIKVNFDICYATVDIMRHVKQLGRHLTRLMPKKEHGTITEDVGRAVRELKGSGVLFRKDKTAIVHVGLGKVSLEEDALRENVAAFTNALLLAKPAGLKKSSKYAGYVETFHICSTMGPSFPVSIQSLSMAVDRFNRLQRV